MFKRNRIKRVSEAKPHVAMLLAALLAVAALSVGSPPVAHADTITVDSTTNTVADDGFCSLREAITAANTDTASGAAPGECPAGSGADTIELGVSVTYSLDVVDNSTFGDNGLPSITSPITINGNGSTIERGALAPDFRIFHVEEVGQLTLNEVTVTGGVASGFSLGGGIRNLGTVTITGSTISGNSASSGGGIYVASVDVFIFQATLAITNSTISGNSATNSGGGIYSFLGTLTVTNSTISGNSATNSGGGISNFGTAAVTESNLSGNSASVGGGINSDNVDGIIFETTLDITNSNISGNSATASGGGINNGVSTLTVTNSTISDNSAAASAGGGINNAGSATITDSTLSGNSANLGGGIRSRGTLTVTSSTINGNSANGDGGGIFTGRTLTVTNSTISGNSATGDGGGIWNGDSITVINSTLSGNSATGSGGGIHRSGGTVILTNVIIANSPSGGDCAGPGSITSLGHNLDSDNTCNLTDPDDLPGVDPILGPLENNGGATDTHALRRGSPAIGAADNVAAPATDQRGVVRPHGPDTDIGAYEYNLCTLVLDLSYTDGTATVEATVGTLAPATANIWATFQSDVSNLISTAIPVIDPPVSTVVASAAVPAQGVLAIFATLTTPEDGIICSDFKILDTGSAP